MTVLLSIIAVTLLAISVWQITKIFEISNLGAKKDDSQVASEKDNDLQGKLMFAFLVFIYLVTIYSFVSYTKVLLPESASEHGYTYDTLLIISFIIIFIVQTVTQALLHYFAYKYRGRSGNKAYFFAHNNKLEIVWTVVPTIILTALIIYGLRTWDRAMNPDITDATVIEVYSKQFDWTARYSGDDNILGEANYKLVEGRNTLGVDINDENASDDIVVREVHLPVNKPVLLKFRSRDVIHSAFLPHFRVQMNCVPGLSTQFAFTPTKTTQEMKETEGEDFEYVLLCNKICGSAHFNMQMKFVVESEEDYNKWIASQKTLKNTLTLK